MKKLVLMSGLPRSGSTLLSALLNQNPSIHTEPASPLLNFMESIEDSLPTCEAYGAYPKPDSIVRTIQNLFQSYYFQTERPVVVDKNRAWSEKIDSVERFLMVKAKIIYPVRDLTGVTASLLRIAHNAPFNEETGRLNFLDNSLVRLGLPINDESRCKFILSKDGMVGQCMVSLANAFNKNYKDRFLFVEYDSLVKSPQEELNKIYDFIEEDNYNGHDFDKIKNPHREKDHVFSAPDLHKIRSSISPSTTDAKLILPTSVHEGLQGKEMWRG